MKLIPDWFVTGKIIKTLFAPLYADVLNILYFNKDPDNAVFNYNEMDIVNIDLNNIRFDDNFDGDDPDTIILDRLLARAY